MAKKLVPDYDIALGKDANTRQGVIQNIFDKISQSEKEIYAKMSAPIGKPNTGVTFYDIAKNFVRKNADDTVTGVLSIDRQIKSVGYQGGALGQGWSLSRRDDGKGVLEVDNLIVRDSLSTQVLTYEKLNTVGGTLMLSAAWCSVEKVTTSGTGTNAIITIYYKADGVGLQRWVVGDQALIKSGIDKYLLTVVTAVYNNPDDDGLYRIVLYNGETADNSGAFVKEKDGNYVPEKGDVIVQYGNRISTYPERQNIILITATDGDERYPSIEQYRGVNNFSLSNKMITKISKDVYFGNADKSAYIWWNKDNTGQLLLKGTLVQSPSGNTFPNIIFRGQWSYGSSYYPADVVTHNGSSYICITTDAPSVTSPDANANWVLYVSKGNTGDTGTPGINSRTVSLTTNKQTYEYNSDGVLKSGQGTSTLTASTVNTSGTVFYQFYVNGVSVQNTTSNTYVLTPENLIANMPKVVNVYIRENTTTGTPLAADTLTIYGLQEGSDAYTIIMSNESHTLPAYDNGTVKTYAGSGNRVVVYRGTTRLTPVFSTPGSWTDTYLFSRELIVGDISPGGASIVDNEIILGNCSNMPETDDVVVLAHNFNIENKVTARRDQTFTKSKDGSQGEQGIAVRYTRWKSGVNYYDGTLTGNADRYLDYITDYDSNGLVSAYKCKLSHLSSGLNRPSAVGGASYWEAISYIPVIASDLVLANQAVIGGFVFSPAYDEFGNPVTDTNQQFRSSDSVTNPNILIKGNGYASFAKGKVLFDENGNSVLGGSLDAVGGKIKNLSIENLYADGMQFSPEAVESLSTLNTPQSENLSTAAPFGESVANDNAHAETATLTPSFDGFVTVSVDYDIDSTMIEPGWAFYVDETISGTTTRIYSQSARDVSGTITENFTFPVFNGRTYKVYAQTQGTLQIGFTYGNSCYIKGTAGSGTTITNVGVKTKTKIGSDGMFSWWNSTNYMYFNSNNEFSVRKGNYGIKIDTTGVYKWSGGAWTPVSW